MTAVSDPVGEFLELDPVRAALVGVPVQPGVLTDYSPEGWAARLDRLRAASAEPDPALAERVAAESGYAEAGLAAELNLVTSPPILVHEHLAQLARDGDQAALAAGLAAVPRALRGYARTLRAAPRPPARRQAEMVLGAVRSWAGSPEFGPTGPAEAARRAFGEFADVLEREILPTASEQDGVGPDRYRAAARFHLGVDLDARDCYDTLVEELDQLRAATTALAATLGRGTFAETCAALNTDPLWTISGAAELRAWAQQRLDAAAAACDALDLPARSRGLEVHVVAEAGPVRYLPPAADGTRPARVVWPMASAEPVPVWNQTTMLHHEGVPGHHLQLGGVRARPQLAVAGNAEGWAVYAEGLMHQAGALAPEEELGYLTGLRLNVAMALVDLALHNGFPLPDTGQPWSLDGAAAFLAAESAFPVGSLYFTVLRSAAWPAQAITYSWGARQWRSLRASAAAVNAREFHSRLLALGPCGLSVLRSAAHTLASRLRKPRESHTQAGPFG
ncbi:DUF885 family protein [Goodfellowiella coeruleoviolacea]|uniref:Uncharacterized conserved protein, DUF885 familyt n=1 Tax=Goodfellowiella coeruleoviolacea TaxID=334858 RepID=A0AAE3GJB9_9PSEU|nr:DUF885 family protein [Goodfellowiella coeruleoviolacea]MCP2168570.1 Uncharacterized conserved protein, DUF885 familyt [Goodfellowiella coeruleoviolacea]